MVLCRTTEPLIDLAFSLIGAGIPATVRGRDIGASLNRIIDAVGRMESFSFAEFGACLDEYKRRTVAALSQKEDNDLAIESFVDRAASVETVHLAACGRGVNSIEGLKQYVETLFDEKRGAVMLSTVHKAKGLENDRVFILHPELMPHPRALRGWEIEQERNLRYVALTRAKSELYFVTA